MNLPQLRIPISLNPISHQNRPFLPVACYFRRQPYPKQPISAPRIPVTDRIIDFGKYKGKMLGTLPSSYLKWMSKELRVRDTMEWAKLADQVLRDPIYKDRIEWEFADNLLSGDRRAESARRDGDIDAASELFQISKRFGWDFDDEAGWGKIKFELLGTSMGGRIPRLDRSGEKEDETMMKRREPPRLKVESEVSEKRKERIERSRKKTTKTTTEDDRLPRMWRETERSNTGMREERRTSFGNGNDGDVDGGNGKIYPSRREREVKDNPFPGREAFLRKVAERRRFNL